jgi:hypothetical protein
MRNPPFNSHGKPAGQNPFILAGCRYANAAPTIFD